MPEHVPHICIFIETWDQALCVLTDPFKQSPYRVTEKQKQHFTLKQRQPVLQQLKLSIPTWAFLLVQLVTGCHRPVATRATVRASICCTAGSSETCRSWLSIRLHYRARLYSSSSVRHKQLWIHSAESFTSSILYSVSWTPNFYSASKTCNCDVCEKPGVRLV